MFEGPSTLLKSRLQSLQDNLATENPILIDAVDSFKELDIVAYRLGLLTPEESFATTISWWPLISVLGTFSAGKSSFLNSYLDVNLQLTGNQAVDDKFTVICYSQEEQVRVYPVWLWMLIHACLFIKSVKKLKKCLLVKGVVLIPTCN